ncbi:hypothetical protein D3C72_2173980 [compost metagenome]
MQCLDAGHIEHAVVGVVPGNAPQVAPGAFALQALGQFLFVGLEPGGLGRVHVDRQFHGHLHVEQHAGISFL